MAAVICSTIFFLAAMPMPGGASIRQTGIIPSFHVKNSNVLQLRRNAGEPARRDLGAEIRCPFAGLLGGSSRSVRLLALLSTWAGREPERSWRRSLVAITRPPKSWVKTVGFTIVRVSDPGGQFSGSRGQLAFTGTSWVTATTSAMNDAGDAGDERT